MNQIFREYEAKWQKAWDQNKVHKTPNPKDQDFDKTKPSFYVLDMFPYPSGSGLHVGHASGYIGTDIVARKKRMEGYQVLHPMGWDAFGLPAEQYAIQTGQHPKVTTEINTNHFRKQLKNLGLSYDWDREINTSDPDYYKWTQWVFLQLYKKGLVYQKQMPVWWCDELKTVLANEEVINGRSERGNYPCERRPLNQWVFKITEYAEKLLQGLDELDWPESVKKMQRDWIGRSEGAMIRFNLLMGAVSNSAVDELAPAVTNAQEREDLFIEVFSTRPDTLFGVSAVVLAPEHPLVKIIVTKEQLPLILEYKQKTSAKSERDRKAQVEAIDGCFTGAYANHPLTDKQVPIYIAEYVLADYGTGAVMAVPSHDERDFIFAKTMGIDHSPVIIKSDLLPQVEAQVNATSNATSNTTFNATFNATVNDDTSNTKPASSTATANLEIQNNICFTEPGFLINSMEFTGLESQEAGLKIAQKLESLGLGRVQVTYKIRDWIFSRQRYWGEPFPLLIDKNEQVVVLSENDLPVELPDLTDFEPSPDGSSPLARVQDWVEVTLKNGEKAKRVTDTMPGWAGSCWYYLRFMDPLNPEKAWSLEAVNYWKQVDLYVGGASHAVMHLLYARFWHKVLFDLGLVPTSEPFKKLFNQGMVTAFAFKDLTGRLVPTDEVIATKATAAGVGGSGSAGSSGASSSVATGYQHIKTGEPVERFISKMAKSLKNVVNPDDVINQKGCDVLRLYQMFMGPLDDDKPWDDVGLSGADSFLKRLWNFLVTPNGEIKMLPDNDISVATGGGAEGLAAVANADADGDGDGAANANAIEQNWRALHKALKRVNDAFILFNFNTAVAAFMECLNDIKATGKELSKEQIIFLIKMMQPFTPHLSAELWSKLDQKGWIDNASWPELDMKYLIKNDFELVMQINGKVRKKKVVDIDTSQEQAFSLAESEMSELLTNKTIIKKIFVLNKLVNFVIK